MRISSKFHSIRLHSIALCIIECGLVSHPGLTYWFSLVCAISYDGSVEFGGMLTSRIFGGIWKDVDWSKVTQSDLLKYSQYHTFPYLTMFIPWGKPEVVTNRIKKKKCDRAAQVAVYQGDCFSPFGSLANAVTHSILLMGLFNQQAVLCCRPVLHAKTQYYEIASQWLWV